VLRSGAREVISAAAELLGRDVAHPEVGDDDLDSAVAALFAVQHALSEYLDVAAEESDTARLTRVAALLVRSEHTQAVVVDAILARRPEMLLSNFMNGVKRLPATWTPERR
jgi:hypothetical protein